MEASEFCSVDFFSGCFISSYFFSSIGFRPKSDFPSFFSDLVASGTATELMFKVNGDFYAAFDESMLLSTDGSFGTLESDFFAGSSFRPLENF